MKTNLLAAIKAFLLIFEYLIIIDALSSWFIRKRSNAFSRAIGVIVDPILVPCYKIQEKFLGNIPVDFSPILGILIIEIIRNIVISILG